MALQIRTGHGELKINSVSMHTAAWRVRDITPLLYDSPLRGQYVVVPGVDGATAVPMRQTDATFSLEFVIVGDVDHTGAKYSASGAYTGPQIGLASNINYLRTNVLTGRTLTGNRTRSATLTVPGEATARTADVHVSLTPGNAYPTFMLATLELRIPQGAFL